MPVAATYLQPFVVVKVPSAMEKVSPVKVIKVPEVVALVSSDMSMVEVAQVPSVALAKPVQPEESCPVPPLVLPMASAFQVPVPIVPKVMIEVVPVLASKAIVPNPKVVLVVAESESSNMVRAKEVKLVVE